MQIQEIKMNSTYNTGAWATLQKKKMHFLILKVCSLMQGVRNKQFPVTDFWDSF